MYQWTVEYSKEELTWNFHHCLLGLNLVVGYVLSFLFEIELEQ